ncbi:Uncharacterized protein dnl_20710 [Desulfonema limicola]|uniref:Uncharacterized protein n=1 Tax=Desulfonema limicola TaxID=45656 RepID=A0A975B6Q8_9BACT|nr:hypothetical protein [Desulfonema limicola]QTA79791.1 Uncharacterized protein dnl_20710 [Desulfonema limicola]
MLNISKYYVYDESQTPIAVQIPVIDFERLEEVIENYGLSKLMDETLTEERLTGKSAFKYYELQKNEMES